MHSSRMRTGRSLTVCRSLLPGGGVCFPGGLLPGGGCLLLGGVCSQGMSALGGVCSGGWGCLLWGVSALGGVCSGGCLLPGGSAPGGGCLLRGECGIPACTEADTLPLNRMTNRCKNITLATTSLRLVTMLISSIDRL